MKSGAYNIDDDVRDVLEAAGMQPTATGGNVDYMEKHIGGWLCVWVSEADDAGSPRSISSKCDIMLARLSDDGETSGEDVALLRCKDVNEAADIIKRMGPI
jgi:hypothetical protein